MQIIPAVIAGSFIGGTALSIFESGEAANLQQEALELKRKQAETTAAQQQIQRSDAMITVLGQQQAQSAAQGIAAASETSGALVRGSYERFSESSETAKSNLQMKEYQMDAQSAQIEQENSTRIFTTMLDTVTKVGQMAMGMPPTGSGSSPGSSLPQPFDLKESFNDTPPMSKNDYVAQFKNNKPYAEYLQQNSGV